MKIQEPNSRPKAVPIPIPPESLPIKEEKTAAPVMKGDEKLFTSSNTQARMSGGEVLRRPELPNGFHNAAEAQKALEAGKEKEKASLERMTPDQQEQYDGIKKIVSGDANMTRALQRLLVEGNIPGKTDLLQNKDLLGNLSELGKQPLADGLERETLIGHLLEEIADPATISQRNKNTCGATTAQILLAKNSPAEYVRLVAGLASPDGHVIMANKETLLRETGTEKTDDSKRTASSRLIQPAFMEFANGTDDYDNAKDVNQGKKNYEGLYASQVDKLLEATNSIKFDTIMVKKGKDVLPAMRRLEESANRGNLTPILFNYQGDGGHFVGVTGVSKDLVYFINPWGQEEDMDRVDFEKRLWAVSIPQEKH
jgi:hypothetical protein